MQNYNETSFALVGVLEQVDDALISLSYGSTALSDMQQSMLNTANAILQFAVADPTGAYVPIGASALAFLENYTGASSMWWSELWDFENLIDITYDIVSQDAAVASAASRTFSNINLHSDSIAWDALIDGYAYSNPNVTIVNSAAPFINLVMAENYIFINWEMDEFSENGGFFDAYFGYYMSIENIDGSQAMLDGEVDLYVDYSPWSDPVVQVEVWPVEYSYIGG